MESKLIKNGENFSFLINGKEYPPMAYITYFEENNDYEKFNEIGMKLYSVTISLAYKPINSGTGFTPFFGGVFDNKGKPDYTCVNEAFDRVLDICPDAYIFPRVYITMPDWWIEENPEEVIETRATGLRENLCSDKFREDAAVLLKYLIDYIENSKYSERIFAGAEGQLLLLRKLVAAGNLTIEEAAVTMNVTVQAMEEMLKKME